MSGTTTAQKTDAARATAASEFVSFVEMAAEAAEWRAADRCRRRFEVLFDDSDDATYVFAWMDEAGPQLQTITYEHEHGGWRRSQLPFRTSESEAEAAREDLHEFTVTVSGCTAEQAAQVMAERIGPDQDYGFDYSLGWA